MQKRGQITTFIFIGLIIVISAGLTLVLQESEVKETGLVEVELLEEVDQIIFKNYVENCIEKVSEHPIKEAALNGGTLNLSSDYIWHDKNKYRLLCFHLEGYRSCVNGLLLRQEIEEEISKNVTKSLMSCVDLTQFERLGYIVTAGNMTVNTEIGTEDVLVSLNYPITLERGDEIIHINEFFSRITYPLGEMYELAMNIINSEITNGYFDKEVFMIANGAKIMIEKHRPYPNIVYSLNTTVRDEEFLFRFALEGEDTAADVGAERATELAHGCCLNVHDGFCFKNADRAKCNELNLSYDENKNCACDITYSYGDPACPDGVCNNCEKTFDFESGKFKGPQRNHGESWCSYDSVLLTRSGEGGMSYVGSGNYLHSCIDGKEIIEECRDYREELCTQQTISGFTRAACRPNRWEDCFSCNTKSCCEDRTLRDCTWSSWLSTNNKCHPTVPPGFKFWEGSGLRACITATETRRCDGFSCENKWVDDAAINCYFQGDCGNYRNIEDELSRGGYFNSDPTDYARNYVYHQPGLNNNPAEIGRMPLRIDLDTRKKAKTMPELPTSVSMLPSLMSAGLEYLEYLSSLSISDFINPFKEPDIEVLDYALCGLWIPPRGGLDCDECEKKLRPCTEYRCKSLGEMCVYEEVQGVGKCTIENANDRTHPEVYFKNESLPEGYKSVPSELDILGMKIKGARISPAIVPHEKLVFAIETSEPTRCKLSFLPNISYKYLPSVWFGESASSIHHNMSLRVPPSFSVPRELYALLKVSELRMIAALANDVEATYNDLTSQFSTQLTLYELMTGTDLAAAIKPFVSMAAALIQDYYEIYQQLKRLSEIMFEELEENKYFIFVRCTDKAGNENKQDFFIKFQINATAYDSEGPKIVKTEPANNSAVGRESAILVFYTDELAECRYSTSDKNYDLMEGAASCPKTEYNMSAVLGGTYKCSANLSVGNAETKYYFRCRDNPVRTESYQFNMQNATNFTESDLRYFNATKPNQVHAASNMLTSSFGIQTPVQDIDFNMYIDDEMHCRYSTNEIEFSQMTKTLACLGAPLEVSDIGVFRCRDNIKFNETIFIQCQDAVTENRNTNSEGYLISLRR